MLHPAGTFEKKDSRASSPPAEAPIPTIGKAPASDENVLLSALTAASGRFGLCGFFFFRIIPVLIAVKWKALLSFCFLA
jgi:hypothetical protein